MKGFKGYFNNFQVIRTFKVFSRVFSMIFLCTSLYFNLAITVRSYKTTALVFICSFILYTTEETLLYTVCVVYFSHTLCMRFVIAWRRITKIAGLPGWVFFRYSVGFLYMTLAAAFYCVYVRLQKRTCVQCIFRSYVHFYSFQYKNNLSFYLSQYTPVIQKLQLYYSSSLILFEFLYKICINEQTNEYCALLLVVFRPIVRTFVFVVYKIFVYGSQQLLLADFALVQPVQNFYY